MVRQHGAARRRRATLAVALLVSAAGSGCSVRRLAVNAVASSLARSGDVFAADSDPELVRDALPFALKTTEALLAESPRHPGLLLAAANGFAQYAWAFVDSEATIAGDDPLRADELRARAKRLYLRARDYGLRGLELRHPGIGERLRRDPPGAAAELEREDVALAYWTAAAWGGAIAAGTDDPALLADVGVVKATMQRLLALDEAFGGGAVHEAMLALEALPAAMGGSPERARGHFARAVELSGGRKASPYVTLAEQISVPAQDRAEFDRLLEQALAVDVDAAPEHRLANLVVQRRARALQARADGMFLGEEYLPQSDDAGSAEPGTGEADAGAETGSQESP